MLSFLAAQFGPFKQASDYVTVREGAHMFYWLFYTTAPVQNYVERPLVVWLQGGPGGSSTGFGNFDILGPLDLSLQERNYTWVRIECIVSIYQSQNLLIVCTNAKYYKKFRPSQLIIAVTSGVMMSITNLFTYKIIMHVQIKLNCFAIVTLNAR